MKMKRLISKIAVVSMCSIILASTATTFASAAGNYHDTLFSIRYTGDGGDVYTEAREKWDYTSSYIYNRDSDYDVRVNVVSTDRAGRNFRILKNCSVKPFSFVGKGEWSYLPNWVKENGYNYCSLMITPATHSPCHIGGLWSPDSI